MAARDLQKKYEPIEKFEKLLSAYTGSPYTVCVDSCTNALLLCLIYSKAKCVIMPNDTYVGVAMACKHANIEVSFENIEWSGAYQLKPTNIYDAAKRFTADMYMPGSHMCISFHYKKHLKIGRGGAILTDSKDAYEWFKLARNCGRNINQPLPQQLFSVCGFNMLMHPELALKGINLMKYIPAVNKDLPYEYYGNLKEQMRLIFN